MSDISTALHESALTVINTLNDENHKLHARIAIMQLELTIATCAAEAANEYYLCEIAGAKTYRLPSEIREAFADAIENYRQATGLEGVELRNG